MTTSSIKTLMLDGALIASQYDSQRVPGNGLVKINSRPEFQTPSRFSLAKIAVEPIGIWMLNHEYRVHDHAEHNYARSRLFFVMVPVVPTVPN